MGNKKETTTSSGPKSFSFYIFSFLFLFHSIHITNITNLTYSIITYLLSSVPDDHIPISYCDLLHKRAIAEINA